MPVYLDVVKNGDELLNVNMLHCYRFSMQISTRDCSSCSV